jgi:hypothetical protein
MIIWRKWGILVVIIALACFAGSNLAMRAIFQEEGYYQEHGWPKAVAALVAALILWPLGRYMNRSEERNLVDPETGEAVKFATGGGNDFFFIPIEFWGAILAVVGVVLFFV